MLASFIDVFDGPGRFGLGLVGGILSLLLWVGLITLIVLGIVWLVRRLRESPQPQGSGAAAPPPARAVLDERFARGEIEAEEYSRRRALLDGRG